MRLLRSWLSLATSRVPSQLMTTKDGQNLDGQSYTRSQRASVSQVYNKSAITDHAGKENHVINWEGTWLVARESQDLNRRIREAIWIKRTPHNMNRDGGGGAHQLSDIYDATITRVSCLGDLSIRLRKMTARH